MMDKPRLLDLFCGAGGAAKGYQRAGFYVIGVDNNPQPHYCGDEFYQADALEYGAAHGAEYDAIHASPPCQHYSNMVEFSKQPEIHRAKRPDLVKSVRQMLEYIGLPFVIENVQRAPLRTQIILCGAMFGLRTYRHRLFESNQIIFQPAHPKHIANTRTGEMVTVVGTGVRGPYRTNALRKIHWSEAMGIDWMGLDEIKEAIPPAYTEFIGKQLMEYIRWIPKPP